MTSTSDNKHQKRARGASIHAISAVPDMPRIESVAPRRRLPLTGILGIWVGVPLVLFSSAWLQGIPFEHVSRDPASLLKFHPLTGVLSYLGVLVWAATAAVALFSSRLLRAVPAQDDVRGTLQRFGFFTILLLLDDLFAFHEELAPDYLHIGQKRVYAMYGLILLWCLWRSRRVLLRSNPILLVAALGCFALSVALDVFSDLLPEFHYALEDSPKFVGIGLWATFFIGMSWHALQALRTGRPVSVPLSAEMT